MNWNLLLEEPRIYRWILVGLLLVLSIAQAAIHGEMDSETDLDDTVGDSEDEDLLLQQAGRRQNKSRWTFLRTLTASNNQIVWAWK